jgi:hypothetical protein
MPKITKSIFALAAFVMMVATSCKKSDVAAPEAAKENTDELVQFIASTTGHPASEIKYVSGQFIIADDAVMTLAQAKEFMANAGNTTNGAQATEGIQHRRSYYNVSAAYAVNVKVFVDATVSADWSNSVNQAIANWNAVNSKLYITRVADRASAHTVVTMVNSGSNGIIAQAYYPSYYGQPGKTVTINAAYSWLDASRKQFAITHEFGHNFGFGHTNSTYGTLVPGTPSTDGASVMNSVVNYWNGFSAYDQQAIRTVYPK